MDRTGVFFSPRLMEPGEGGWTRAFPPQEQQPQRLIQIKRAGPPLRAVQDSENLNLVLVDSIGNDV